MRRRISPRMAGRRVARWGWYIDDKIIVVVFDDGKMALVNPFNYTYSSIRAWNPVIRARYMRTARNRVDMRLDELIEAIRQSRVR